LALPNPALVHCLEKVIPLGYRPDLMQLASVDVSFILIANTLDFSLVTSQWKTHLIKPRQTPNEKNFKLLNKMAAKNRVTTA